MLNALPVIPFVFLAFWYATVSPIPLPEVAAAQDENGSVNVAIQNITLIADEDAITRVAPDNQLHPGVVEFKTMMFNGTVPGLILEFNEGELIRFTLINNGDIVHSLNLHGITGPSQALSGPVKPGENKTWLVKVNPEAPSIFMYHCDGDNLNGVWEHVASGMYGGMVVTPTFYNKQNQAIKEFFITFSEVYNSADKGLFKGTNGVIGSFDLDKFVEGTPDLILTNGMAYKYIPWIGTIGKYSLNNESQLFQVKPSAQGQIDINSLMYLVPIPPGSGVIIDAIFPEEGFYFGNDHDLASLLYGSGFVVSAVDNNTSVRRK